MTDPRLFYRVYTSWDQLWSELGPLLTYRSSSFTKAFEHLAGTQQPHIVETGSWRNDSVEHEKHFGDGASTWLFNWFLRFHGGSGVTIDLSESCTELCRRRCEMFESITGNSIAVLPQLRKPADLLYLDSYDLDWNNDTPAAVHHLKELFAASHLIGPNTLIMVDDNQVSDGTVTGKGRLVHELLTEMGVPALHTGYQMIYSGVWDSFRLE